jgi:hypothetical protein
MSLMRSPRVAPLRKRGARFLLEARRGGVKLRLRRIGAKHYVHPANAVMPRVRGGSASDVAQEECLTVWN